MKASLRLDLSIFPCSDDRKKVSSLHGRNFLQERVDQVDFFFRKRITCRRAHKYTIAASPVSQPEGERPGIHILYSRNPVFLQKGIEWDPSFRHRTGMQRAHDQSGELDFRHESLVRSALRPFVQAAVVSGMGVR
jgi:hypothetical protein